MIEELMYNENFYTAHNHHRSVGFTLIEVLIALVILAIALTAIIKATSQNIRDTAYLQNKTIASWVGTEVINEARIGLIQLPLESENEQETDVLGRKWIWRGKLVSTPNPQIKKISVDVYSSQSNKKITHLESFLYVSEQP